MNPPSCGSKQDKSALSQKRLLTHTHKKTVTTRVRPSRENTLWIDRQTHRQTGRQMDGRTDRLRTDGDRLIGKYKTDSIDRQTYS